MPIFNPSITDNVRIFDAHLCASSGFESSFHLPPNSIKSENRKILTRERFDDLYHVISKFSFVLLEALQEHPELSE